MSNGQRIVPVATGWWWILERSPHARPSLSLVEEFSQMLAWREGFGWKPLSDIDAIWLAPIPGPAVCAALAECAAIESEWSINWSPAVERALPDAEARLYAAIRAERDGAA